MKIEDKLSYALCFYLRNSFIRGIRDNKWWSYRFYSLEAMMRLKIGPSKLKEILSADKQVLEALFPTTVDLISNNGEYGEVDAPNNDE